MDLKRVVGRLAPRWPLLIIAGLIGAVASFIFVQQRNAEAEPVYRADAVVAIPVTEAEDDRRPPTEAVTADLALSLELARTVNETVLSDTDFIAADDTINSLIFSSIAETEEVAIAGATSMRQAYVDADPFFDIAAELDAKLDEAALINTELLRLRPVPEEVVLTPEEAATAEAQLRFLQAEETALNDKIDELAATKVESTDSAEIASIDNQLAGYRADLEVLLAVLRPLEEASEVVVDPAVDGETTEDPATADLAIADQWAIQALDDRLAELQTESASLIVSTVTGAGVDLPAAEVIDESPSVTPTWLGLLVGFLAAALLLSAVLLGFDRVRGVVWQGGDIKNVTVLAEGPAIGMATIDVSDIELHRRKRSVQAIRSAIIGAGRLGEGTIVGFASPPSTDPDVRDDLAFDVSHSISAVGRRVLLVDLGFTGGETRGTPVQESSGLRELFDSVGDDEVTIRARATAAIQTADRRSQGLDVLAADSEVIDPADILAGRPLSELLNQAREAYDVVVVIQPTTTVNSGAGVDAYLQQQVIVCTKGKTRVSELNTVAIPRDPAHVQLVGAAILAPVPSVARSRPMGDGPSIVGDEYGESDFAATGSENDRSSRVSSALRRLGPNETEGEGTVDRIRSLESYSVNESARLQSDTPQDR